MTSLGEIVLKFGATGEDGEAPLRFKAAHINLLVGPNNAGKSLMLRELSGVNPRSRARSDWQAAEYPLTRIVEEVHWSGLEAQAIQQKLLADVFADNPAWDELKLRTWDLLPAIDTAVPQFIDIRDHLGRTLFELAGRQGLRPPRDRWSDHPASAFSDVRDYPRHRGVSGPGRGATSRAADTGAGECDPRCTRSSVGALPAGIQQPRR